MCSKEYIIDIYVLSDLGEIREVIVPAFAESVSEGDVRWEKKVGDQVKEDDVLCEIETDKVYIHTFLISYN